MHQWVADILNDEHGLAFPIMTYVGLEPLQMHVLDVVRDSKKQAQWMPFLRH